MSSQGGSININVHCDLKMKPENVRKENETLEVPAAHSECGRLEERVTADHRVNEQKSKEEELAMMTLTKISRSFESMEAQMGVTNRLLEQLVMEVKGMREDMRASKTKEAQTATSRFEKLLAEEIRTNDLVEKALYAEPSSNLFANSKDRHPHKAYLRSMLEDLEAMKRKLR
ncbi:hypothetical protein R1flu_020698 [Riccia fluitans]|uniref:Uncharacterized protein n=1 Tax=Riccia fluitans TaxID=41844 RepID=A0ABD1ZML6_9MARC